MGSDNFFDHMMYKVMYDQLSMLVQKITALFPALEAQKSGIQALCRLNWALDKARAFLQQMLSSSKLYLAITDDSVRVKFERVKDCLDQSLRQFQLSVPEALAEEVVMLLNDLEGATCEMGSQDRDVGNKIISILQKEKESSCCNDLTEMDVFNEVASELGITSSKAIIVEKKALRQLLDKAHNEDDKKKELIVSYLLHLLRRYEKVQTSLTAVEDGLNVEFLGSFPASLSEIGSEASTGGRESDFSSELSSYGFHRKAASCLGKIHIPPEEFRCPISLQLMSDPVIISSGQTYERICIQKWFEEGHYTCPKTQQKLENLCVTPNYCVKGLIASWCERQSIPIPNPPSPPPSPIANWRWSLASQRPLNVHAEEGNYAESERVCMNGKDVSGRCNGCTQLQASNHQFVVEQLCSFSFIAQCKAAEDVRSLTKHSADARIQLGHLGCVTALVRHLGAAFKAGDQGAQETACFALSNLGVHNNRNRVDLINAGIIPMLLKLLDSDAVLPVKEAAILVLLTISCVKEDKVCTEFSGAVSYLLHHFKYGSEQGVKDALGTLLNLSASHENLPYLINADVVVKLVNLIKLGDPDLTGKCLTILYNLSSIEEGRSHVMEAEGCMSSFVELLDSGTLRQKEQVSAILLVICTNSYHHSQLVLQEGIIPSLVMLSGNGNARGRDKAQKLLSHFREQRQKESVWHSAPQLEPSDRGIAQSGSQGSFSGRKTRYGMSLSFFRQSKSLSLYHC